MSLEAVPLDRCRLSPEQYKLLVRKLGGIAQPIVHNTTTELEAGQRLGVQYVLQFLREGWGDAAP